MTTLADLRAHQSAVENVSALAIAELVRFWRSRPDDPRLAAKQAREVLDDIVATYGLAAGAMAADWYEELRADARVTGPFSAGVQTPGRTEVQDIAGWGLAPMFNPDLQVDGMPNAESSLSRLSGGTQLLVANAARLTVETNIERDPAGARYARHASANACAFCAMVATRGARYRTAESAGAAYHRNCRCIAFPVWPGQATPEAPYVADWRESYYNATEQLGGANDTSAILKLMRTDLGAK